MSIPSDRKPLGLLLLDANLISPPQLDAALQLQQTHHDLLLGEILALRGWIKQETADFFADRWPQLGQTSINQPIGHYLQAAGLLSEDQIKAILEEQRQSGLQFGVLAAYKGWVNQATVNFFLEHLKSTFQPIPVPLYDRQSSDLTDSSNPVQKNESIESNSWIKRLTAANLLSDAQLQILQSDRVLYPDLSIKEILMLRGWLKPKTLDFFQYHWVKIRTEHPIGYYLQEADLLTEQQVQALLRDQWQTGVKLGALAVMRGWLKQETLNVFLEKLAPDKASKSPFVTKHETIETLIEEPSETPTVVEAELEMAEEERAYESLDEFADAQGIPMDIWNKDEILWGL